MKKKNLLLMLLAVMALLLIPVSVQAAAKPGTVKLSSIKAVDYNKINIKWKKVSGATNYIVYYKKAGSSKWVKVKTLDNKKSSYTHTSSKKYPIVVGQKYQYTVKAYNKKTKKSGNYNTKGLTVTASLKMVTGIEAKIEGTTALRGNKINYGEFGLVATEPCWIRSNQIEAARVAMTRYIKRGGKVWIKIFPDKPVTAQPAETRMGKGKGNLEYWVAVVKPGRVMFEISGVSEEIAKEALRLAVHKLPIKCKIVSREALEGGDNSEN